MKVIFLAAMCALFPLNFYGQSTTDQTEEPTKKRANSSVEEISLARDDGSGKPGEIKDSFAAADVPLHCLIKLDSGEPALVKLNVVTVEADGYKPESVIVSVSYKTVDNQDRVNFRVSPGNKFWSAGKYRADVFIDGVKVDSKNFEIIKSVREPEAKKTTQPKTTRRARKH